MNLIKGLILYVYNYFQIARIKRGGIREYNKRITDVKQRLLHDVTVPEESLHEVLLKEAEVLRESIKKNIKQKIADLLKI